MPLASIAACALLLSQAAAAADPALEKGFDGALRGCEMWVLEPGTWMNDIAAFPEKAGLDKLMYREIEVAENLLPPQAWRRANHYWRFPTTDSAGYVLIVSDIIPMCHITGGGNVDLQPTVEAVLASASFAERWEKIEDSSREDMKSELYRSRELASFTMLISRAAKPGERLDRAQVIATGLLRTPSQSR